MTGFLDASGRIDEEDALLVKMISAYPNDFVAPYNYGNALLDQNKPSDALVYFEQAKRFTYGKNRITVAKSEVEALLKLDRGHEAEKVVAETLGDGLNKWFPERAQQLRGMLAK